MSASALALQQAIYTTLCTEVPLTSALGGVHIFDDPPQPLVFPYLSFGPATVRDDDTATERSDEHLISLVIWSRARGRKECNTLADLVRTALHNQSLVLTGHRLINLRHEQTETRRLPDGETTQCTLRLRAVTEPL
jgi:hypothetical protein